MISRCFLKISINIRLIVELFMNTTPAYAGTTVDNHFRNRQNRDHPRLRGDHGWLSRTLRMSSGSPPLTRGPRVNGLGRRSFLRITPAYAGTTRLSTVYDFIHKDHPRLRGDHLNAIQGKDSIAGSPPLTRGPLYRIYREMRQAWITPAYAGTT